MEAKPSELSGEILSLAKYPVKTKTGCLQLLRIPVLTNQYPRVNCRGMFATPSPWKYPLQRSGHENQRLS